MFNKAKSECSRSRLHSITWGIFKNIMEDILIRKNYPWSAKCSVPDLPVSVLMYYLSIISWERHTQEEAESTLPLVHSHDAQHLELNPSLSGGWQEPSSLGQHHRLRGMCISTMNQVPCCGCCVLACRHKDLPSRFTF